MNNEIWLRVLQKIVEEKEVPYSQIPNSVKKRLQEWGNSTGAISLERAKVGAGRIFRLLNQRIVEKEIKSIDPGLDICSLSSSRLRNLAVNKDTKAGRTTLECFYFLCKAIGESLVINEINVSAVTKALGCFALSVKENSEGIICNGDLILVENQQLLDNLNWVPSNFKGIILYYAGNLSSRLRSWIKRSLFTNIIHFPDYDAVGISNFANLLEDVPNAKWFWIPGWKEKLAKYGCKELRKKGNQDSMFENLWNRFKENGFPDSELENLMIEIRKQGKMLEQEAVLI